MKFCPKCNLEYEDKFTFCHQCGSKLQEKIEQFFCPYCGNKIETDGTFCPYCGNALEEAAVASTVSNLSFDKYSSNNSVLPKHNINIEYKDVAQNQPVYEIKDSEERFFSKRHLFTYDGRRGRLSYISVQMFLSFLLEVVALILVPVVLSLGEAGFLFAFLIDLVLAYPIFCNTAKRMHDLNWPTSWAAILTVLGIFITYGNKLTKAFARTNNTVLYGRMVVVLIFCVPFLYLTFKKGTDGPNQYGPDPL